MQMNIFEELYETYKIKKPIRLIEFFAGYGSQALALKYLGVEFEHWKTCEWAIKSIQAYKDIHFCNEVYEGIEDKECLVQKLYELGVSINYNEPATKDQLQRKNIQELKNIYSNIKINSNLVNIQNVKGIDLEIQDTDKYDYILTYSFPCQDLSLAGKGKGMADTSTRSGMLWEVERILKECKELGELPQILLMENVPEVKGSKNVEHFNKWQLELEKLGYKNYHQNLIATDFGIPQTRNRTFMISILGNYNYTFPEAILLELNLEDLLEEKVEENYYIKKDLFIRALNWEKQQNPVYNIKNTLDNVPTITTRVNSDVWILIPEATKKGYTRAKKGDCIDLSQINSKTRRGRVQTQKAQTITTQPNLYVVLDEKTYRIRKLTPKECFRLMGVKDEDYDNVAKNQSNSSLYHLAGDSIVVNVLMAIFKELL